MVRLERVSHQCDVCNVVSLPKTRRHERYSETRHGLGSRFEPASLIEALRKEQVFPRVERFDCLIAATDAMAQRLSEPEHRSVVVSAHSAVAICLANRHAGVRAVLGLDPSQAAGDATSVGANLLVVDPKKASAYLLRQMVLDFCRTAQHACPDDLKERLG